MNCKKKQKYKKNILFRKDVKQFGLLLSLKGSNSFEEETKNQYSSSRMFFPGKSTTQPKPTTKFVPTIQKIIFFLPSVRFLFHFILIKYIEILFTIFFFWVTIITIWQEMIIFLAQKNEKFSLVDFPSDFVFVVSSSWRKKKVPLYFLFPEEVGSSSKVIILSLIRFPIIFVSA